MSADAKKSLVIVEGKSEFSVLPKLCEKHGLSVNFEIKSEKSISQLKQAIPVYLKNTQLYRRLWIIADADKCADNVWTAIKNLLLKSSKYNFRTNMPLPAGGAVIKPIDPEDITVGVWIMPDNAAPGMLEDFILGCIRPTDTLIGKAIDAVNELDSERHKHPNIFRPTHKSKACVHTWLAWNHKPGESLATAIEKGLLDLNNPTCQKFIQWLAGLNK